MADLLSLDQPEAWWGAAAAFFALLALICRSTLFVAPVVGALAAAASVLLGLRLDFISQCYLFGVVALLLLTPAILARVHERAEPASYEEEGAPPQPSHGAPGGAPGLVGQVAHTVDGFANGVGRVLVGGRAFAAELAHGGDTVAPGEALRIVGVSGGVKLMVEQLSGRSPYPTQA